MKFEIHYYINETAKRGKTPAFKETIQGDKNYAEKWAQNKLKSSQFKFYEIIQK